MSCPIALRYMGGSTAFVPASNSVITIPTPAELPTTGFAVSFRYKTYTRGGFGKASGVFGNDQGWFARAGSFKYGRQGINDCQVYAYLNAPNDFATPRRLRFRNFYQPNGDMRWHNRILNIYVEAGSAKCDEYEDGVKLGATHTVDYTGDTTTPVGNLLIGRSDQTFNGLMSEVRFYPTLTEAQIKQISTHGHCSVDPLQNNPLSDLPSTYLDTVGGATGTGTATTYSPDVPTQLPVALAECKASASGGTQTPASSIATVAVNTPFSRTIMGRLKVSNYFGNAVASLQPSGSDSFSFNIENNTGYPFIWTVNSALSGTICPKLSRPFPKNKWTHFAAVLVFNGTTTTGKIYVNSQLWGTETLTRNVYPHDYFLIGSGAEYKTTLVTAYERELTAEEIRDNCFSYVVPSNPKIKLDRQEGAGNINYDSSGNGYDGTTGSLTWYSDVPSKAPVQIDGNLVKNGDFSYVPVVNVPTTAGTRWIDGTSAGGLDPAGSLFSWGMQTLSVGSSAVFDTSTLYNGKPTMKLMCATTNGQVLLSNAVGTGLDNYKKYAIPVKPSTAYTVTFWMKTQRTSGVAAAGAGVFVSERGVDGGQVMVTGSSGVLVTTDWTKYTITVTTNASTRKVYIRPHITGNDGAATLIMDAWFADISLTEVNEVTHLPVSGTTPLTCP